MQGVVAKELEEDQEFKDILDYIVGFFFLLDWAPLIKLFVFVIIIYVYK